MLKKHEFKIFTATRIIAIGIRPLILYLCLILPNPELGLNFALLLSAVASSFLVLCNQNHRHIYDYFIENAGNKKGLGGREKFFNYLEGVILHLIIFLPVAAALCWIWVKSFELTIITIVFILLEKYYDDDQRIAIYQKRYLEWSINFCFRSVGPSLTLLGAMLIWQDYLLYVYTISALIFFGLYLKLVRKKFAYLLGCWFFMFFGQITTWWTYILRYGKIYRQEYAAAQAWIFLTGSFGLLDRFMVVRLQPTMLAEYLFISNLANLIPLLHGLLYFTKIRPQLVDRGGPIFERVFSRHNLKLPLGLTMIFPIGVFMAELLGILNISLEYWSAIGIGALYGVFAMGLVLTELAFWRIRRGWLLGLELTSVFVFALIAGSVYQLGLLTVNWIPWVLLVALLGKYSGTFYLLLQAQNDPRIGFTD